jgi:hypothetical protein
MHLMIDETALSPQAVANASKALNEYVVFANSIKNVRVRRKAEAQLGRRVVQLRQVLSVEQFSAMYAPIACDHLDISATKPSKHPPPDIPTPQ